MSDGDHQQNGQPGPSLVAVPFLTRKLDELYDALKEARYAQALLEAKACLLARDYSKALRLVQQTRETCVSAKDRPRPTGTFGMRAGQAATVEVLEGAAVVIRLLQPLSDWQESQPKPAEADPPPQAFPPAGRAPVDDPAEDDLDGDFLDEPVGLAKQYSSVILERGAFSQLLSAAQQCGLVSSPDAIIAVRDREFPAGRYQRAFEMIETLYIQFSAQASRRLAALRREETQYKAGTLKMGTKEWLIRQRRVTEQNQKIDRARRHFTRVLDGLRVIRMSGEE
jgi:hypothetical protein